MHMLKVLLWRPAVAVYGIALLLCLAALTWTLRLHHADLSIPLSDTGDSLGVLALVKGQIENGWYLLNPRLGAPGVYDLRDYPVTELVPLAVLKLFGLAVPNACVVFNLFALLTFPLTTWTTLAVLRRLEVHAVPAVAAALLYTFLPYHAQRLHEGHLFLTLYCLVPLAVLLALSVCEGQPVLFRYDAVRLRCRLHLLSGRALAAGGLCLLIALSGVYYAFFTCFLLLVAGAAALVRYRQIHTAVSALLLVGLIAVGVAAAALPTILHQRQVGVNPDIDRAAEEADYFGLKIPHLLLPVQGHRLPVLAKLRAAYSNPWRQLENENNFATLGAVGSMGFLLLLGCLLARGGSVPGPLENLKLFNVACLLLSLLGGLGSLASFLIIPQIRCYNRISVFIGFFALAALAWAASRLFAADRRPLVKRLGWLVVPLVTAVGLWDQTPRNAAPDHAQLARTFHAEAAYVRQIEENLSEGAMVFQLPYVRFPEAPPRHRMTCYQHLGPYLHSQKLHWSFGAMVNRQADAWQRYIAALPVAEMVRLLAFAEFQGIYVDRRGYPDGARALEAELTRLLGCMPRVSPDGERTFFALTDYSRLLRERYSGVAWEEEKEKAVGVPCVLYENGFFPVLTSEVNCLRWCRREGVLALVNPGRQPKQVEFSLTCRADVATPFPLHICSDLFNRTEQLDAVAPMRTFRFTLPPGRHLVRLTATPPRDFAPVLPGRVFYLKVDSLAVVR